MMRYLLAAAAVAFLLNLAAAGLCLVKAPTHASDKGASLLTLDVCSKGGPVVAHSAEYTPADSALRMPVFDENGRVEIVQMAFALSVFSDLPENPPNES